MGIDSMNRRIHIRGLHELLVSLSKHGTKCSDYCKKIFFTTVKDSVRTSSAHETCVHFILLSSSHHINKS